MKASLALLSFVALAGCDVPRDPEGTLERVRAARTIRVGVVAAGEERRGQAEQARFVARLGEATGARSRIERGSAEPLLARLEAGELDLVVGGFAAKSPWEKRVTLTEPLASWRAVDGEQRLAAAVRNGENAWLMLVDRVARGGNDR